MKVQKSLENSTVVPQLLGSIVNLLTSKHLV